MNYNELCEAAKEARLNSYSPYSKIRVGAALLTCSGIIYNGCNIENSAYTPSNCAERTAFFNAVSNGERQFKAIAIVGEVNGKISDFFPPCGVCRQVMSEFCDKEAFDVILVKSDGYDVVKLKDLLPLAF